MNRLLKLLFLGLLLSLLVACNLSNDAVNYNNKIVELQNNVIGKSVAFSGSIDEMDSVAAKQMLADVISEIKKSRAALKTVNFEGDNVQLKTSFLNLLNFYQRVYTEDYKKIVTYYYQETLSEAQEEELQGIVAAISKEEENYDLAFEKAQEAFAKKYHFKLLENKMQEAIDTQ